MASLKEKLFICHASEDKETFEEVSGMTLVIVHDLYSSKEALGDAIATGSSGAMSEQLKQLEQLIASQRNF